MQIENHQHVATEIASIPADVETIESYEDKIHQYINNDYTFIPMPKSMDFYNTEEGWIRDIEEEQIITEDTHLMEVLRKMKSYPFLLIDRLSESDGPRRYYVLPNEEESIIIESDILTLIDSNSLVELAGLDMDEMEEYISNNDPITVHEFRDQYPKEAEERLSYRYDDQYGIITMADLNKRGMKQMLYRLISELPYNLGNKIEEEYPDSEEILENLHAVTIGRWKQDKIKGLNMHVSEHMNLIEIMNVIQSSDSDFVEQCGFESKSDVQTLNKINDIRNRVMHANRSLIYGRKEIAEVIEVVNEIERILGNIE